MEINTENPWPLRARGKGFTLKGMPGRLSGPSTVSYLGGHLLTLKLLYSVCHLHYSISLTYIVPHTILGSIMSPTAWVLLALSWQKN